MSSLANFKKAREQGGGNIREKAAALVKEDRKAQLDTRSGQPLITQDRRNLPFAGKEYDKLITQDELYRGDWYGIDAKDQALDELFQDYASAPSVLGDKTLPFKEYTEWIKDKRNRQQYQNFLQMSTWMINPKDPSSASDAQAILPELRTLTEKDFRRECATQFYLRHMLMSGRAQSKEDLQFCYSTLLSPLFALPTYPLWDLNGRVLGGVENTNNNDNAGESWGPKRLPADRFLFSYYLWKPELSAGQMDYGGMDEKYPGATVKQIEMKTMILRRIFAQLREMEHNDAKKKVITIMARAMGDADQQAFLNLYYGPKAVLPELAYPVTLNVEYADLPANRNARSARPGTFTVRGYGGAPSSPLWSPDGSP